MLLFLFMQQSPWVAELLVTKHIEDKLLCSFFGSKSLEIFV